MFDYLGDEERAALLLVIAGGFVFLVLYMALASWFIAHT